MYQSAIRKLVLTFAAAAGLSLLSGCVASSASEEDASSVAARAAAEQQNGGGGVEKVSICHYPPGNPANMHVITVGSPAVKAHLAHGDKLVADGCADTHGGGDNISTGGGHDAGIDSSFLSGTN